MTNRALPSDVARIAGFYFSSLGTPFAIEQLKKLNVQDWRGLAESSVDPRKYRDAYTYACDAAAAGFLKKYQGLPVDVDQKAAALQKWWEGERDCFKTNLRLTRLLPAFRSSADQYDPGVLSFFEKVRKVILKWIGPRPPDLVKGRFGPGATFSDNSRKATVPDKMSSDPVLTPDAYVFLPQWLGTMWGSFHARRQSKIQFVPGNSWDTAPKTALSRRSIGKEPPINVFFQLPYGDALKDRMRRFAHWDMNRAQEIHRLVAQRSSVTREFATLDLSNASDTLARVLVELLLPTEWYQVLSALRSPKTKVNGKWVCLEKFSSMGNGFTFELETIIFAAISVVVTRECGHGGWLGRDVYVFGDDIIVKDDVVRPLKAVLGFCGFTLNDSKSFWGDTPFRESCGGDYFDGKSVRPYYLKEEVNEPSRYIALANGMRACIERIAKIGDSPGLRAWFACLDFLPSEVRKCRGPEALGDIVIHDVPDKWSSRWGLPNKEQDGIRYLQAWLPKTYKRVSWKYFHPDVVLACAAYGTGGGVARGVMPRDAVLSYGVDWIAFS